jgi:ABC-2 type transport system ATP-binding protein
LRAAQPGTVALFGDRLHILVEAADLGRLAIEQVLRAEGIPLHELRVIEPTLEDVFTSAIPGGSH